MYRKGYNLNSTAFLRYACMLYISFGVAQVGGCPSGWFGSLCEYKCQCRDNKCTDKGECQPGSKCIGGKFGMACQFENTITSIEVPPGYGWLVDEDDTTCSMADLKKRQLFFPKESEFSWFRIVVNDPKYLAEVILVLENHKPCLRMQSYLVDKLTRDIICYAPDKVSNFMFKGDGVNYLCSVYISGGRNIALKQKAKLSSSYLANTADKSVDGDLDTCARSSNEDKEPSLSLMFRGYPQHIFRMIIYPPMSDDLICESQGFHFQTFDEKNKVIERHQDQSSNCPETYSITLPVHTPVKKITFDKAQTKKDKVSVINFCEVELFGEPSCPPGTYGLECELNCSCIDNKCYAATGGCLTGCQPGKWLLGCTTECDKGFYGVNCKKKCSRRCRKGECSPESGQCTLGCELGYFGKACDMKCGTYCVNKTCERFTGKCTEGCVHGHYGMSCSMACTSCKHSNCNTVTGMCIEGCVQGYYGKACSMNCSTCKQTICSMDTGQCLEGCVVGYYGKYCLTKCSAHCITRSCNRYSGECIAGCTDGYFGKTCLNTCPVNCKNNICNMNTGFCKVGCAQAHYGPNCSKHCPDHCQNRVCRKDTGYCHEGCVQGYYGHTCVLECPVKCKLNTCNVLTGICDNGCIEDLIGPNCTIKKEAQKTVVSDTIKGKSGLAIWVVTVLIGLSIFMMVSFLMVHHQKYLLQPSMSEQNKEIKQESQVEAAESGPIQEYDEIMGTEV